MAMFEVRVPDTDEGEVLGDYEAECIPRVGERFCIDNHPAVCRGEHDTFIGVVESVEHYARYTKGPGALSTKTVVWLREEHGAPAIYCTCANPPPADAAGGCDDCGKIARPT